MKYLNAFFTFSLLFFFTSVKSQITCGNQPLLGLGDDTICYSAPFTLNATSNYTSYLWQDGSTDSLYTINGAGTYFVTVTDTLGNVLTNGDFEMGSTGFTSNYTDSTGGGSAALFPEGHYAVVNNPQIHHANFAPCVDNTSGAGNMMVVNGSSTANDNVWCQTIPVSPNTNYLFSAWVSTVHPLAPAELQFSINGNLLGAVFYHSGTLCSWEQFYEVWNSGANTSITICITNQNTTTNGNDFAIDDITFTPVCIQSDTVNVVNPPTANFSVPNACFGTSTTFNNTSIANSGTITSNDWKFGDGGTSAVISPTYIYPNTGNYSVELIVENSYLCADSITKTVNIFNPFVADFIADTVCANTVTSFTDVTVSGSQLTNWDWDFGNNITSTLQNPTNGYPQGGNYTVSLQVTDANGCVDDTTMQIVVDYLPQPSFSSNQVCLGDSTVFTDNSSVTGSTITDWNWVFGDGNNINNIQNPAHVYANSGTYNATLTVSSAEGCSGVVSNMVTVNALPTATFIFNSPCEGNATNFTDQSQTNITTWLWNFGDSQNSNQQNPSNLYAASGNFDVELVVQDANGCIDTTIQTVAVNPAPDVSFDSLQSGCVPLLVSLIGSSTSIITNWNWDLGNGSTSTNQTPNLTYNNAGSYDVSLTVTDNNGCTNTLLQPNYINVYPNPIADFLVNPTDANEYDPTIQFTDLSQFATVWNWTLGDGATSNNTNPIHTYAGAGTYPVTLFVETIHGCKDQITKEVIIKPVFSFYVPNAFTPNDPDAINDSFKGFGVNIDEFNMMIFDRWGEKIFETSYLEEGWNGTYNGEQVPNDVYVYKIKLRDILGKNHDYIGRVSVVN